MNAVLNEQRARYLEHYAAVIDAIREAHEPYCTELLLQPGELDDPEPAFNRYRIDIAVKTDRRTRLIDANMNPIRLQLSLAGFPVPVHLNSFVWNDAQVRVRGGPAPIEAIAEWSRRWMDLDDERPEGADGMRGVIHSVVRPRRESKSVYCLNVDMGSAPVDALEELLAIVCRGAKRVDIATSTNDHPGP